MNLNATLIFQAVALLLFVLFVMKLVWPPVIGAMKSRQAKIADGLAAAERGNRSLQDAAAKSDEALKAARTQAQEILGSASKQAAQLVEQAKLQAKAEGERIVGSAHAETERELARARETLRQQVGELAVAGAAQILGREIDGKTHADVLKALAAKI